MPRTFETTVYKFNELSPEAQKHALEKWRGELWKFGDYVWLDALRDSFVKLFEFVDGLSLGKRWELNYDYPSRAWCRVEFDTSEVAQLSGPRAQAWLENNLLGSLRLPDNYKARWKKCDNIRTPGTKYGYRIGKAGEIKSCPFTGVCYDDDLLDALIANVNSGMTLEDSFNDLAVVTSKLGEQEIEYQNSDEYIRETIIANGYEFTEDGEMI